MKVWKTWHLGIPVERLERVGGLHATSGLPGYPARDYFAESGTRAVAPVNGRVRKLSGHSPANGPVAGPHGPFGWSVYLSTAGGDDYYLTHLGERYVSPGQLVHAGQHIGTVGDYARYGTPSHVHMGIKRAPHVVPRAGRAAP